MAEEKSAELSSDFSSFAERGQALIDAGDLDGARAVFVSGREAARKMREAASEYEASFTGRTESIDRLLSPKP